jgi:hypothetical protein
MVHHHRSPINDFPNITDFTSLGDEKTSSHIFRGYSLLEISFPLSNQKNMCKHFMEG